MGKFSGILLVSDIDGTLIKKDHTISKKNIAAIKYFQEEGGKFTLATGRVPKSIALFLNYFNINAPVICYNGSSIYSYETNKILWQLHLDEACIEVLDYVNNNLDYAGIEVYKDSEVYFCKMNETAIEHIGIEKFKYISADYKEIPPPWTKVLFVQKPELTEGVRSFLLNSPYAKRYKFIKSAPPYYEMINKAANKGRALLELTEIIGQDINKTIAVGDNENDIEMIRTAGIGVAVENAIDSVKKEASFVTAHHEEDAIYKLIQQLDKGRLGL